MSRLDFVAVGLVNCHLLMCIHISDFYVVRFQIITYPTNESMSHDLYFTLSLSRSLSLTYLFMCLAKLQSHKVVCVARNYTCKNADSYWSKFSRLVDHHNFKHISICMFHSGLATMARVTNFVELTIIWNSSLYIVIYIYNIDTALTAPLIISGHGTVTISKIFQLPGSSPAQVAVLQGHDGLALKSTCFPSTAYVPRTKLALGLAYGFCWWVGVVGNWKVEDHLSLELQAEMWLTLLWNCWLHERNIFFLGEAVADDSRCEQGLQTLM